MKRIRIISIGSLLAISICLLISCDMERKIEKKKSPVKVFYADFSKKSPLSTQFYSWEGREFMEQTFQPLSSIQCKNGVAHLRSSYDKKQNTWKTQMMSTAGLFESDNFTCKFEGKFSKEPGSWQGVITYGTGTYWSSDIYSDGIKWPAGGEIDAFEQAGGYSETPTSFVTPSAHFGSGSNSGYSKNHEKITGETVEFVPEEWHEYKFSLNKGIVKVWIDGEMVGEKNFKKCEVNNEYLVDYHPFLKPQAFYLLGEVATSGANKESKFDFQVKNFEVYQEDKILCEKLKIYPQMWNKNTELTFPVNAELYFDKIYTPSNVSNKACTWKSSNESVAIVKEGYVKTVGEGTAVVTATCGKASAQYTLKVSNNANIPCAQIKSEIDTLTVKEGRSKNIQYDVYPRYTTDKVVTSIENTQIAELSGTTIKAKKVGETKLILKCGMKRKEIDIVVRENSKEPFAKYDLNQITRKIGLNDSQKGYETKATVQNLGEDGKVLDMAATYSVSDICVDDKWKKGLSGVEMKTPVLDNEKELTKDSFLYFIKASECSVRTNDINDANCMPSVDITDKDIVVRYGDVKIYQRNLNSDVKTHCIAIYAIDGKSSVFIDGEKVVEDGKTGYIQDLKQLIIKTNEKNGIQSFAAYSDVEFTDKELENMTN